jgi:hypothetical protein
MAKTKLLAAITVQAAAVDKSLTALTNKLDGAPKLIPEHWTLLSNAKTEIDKLDQTISKMKANIAGWDGSTKFKNIFKNKAKLAEKRQVAINKFTDLQHDASRLHTDFDDAVKAMQLISKAG